MTTVTSGYIVSAGQPPEVGDILLDGGTLFDGQQGVGMPGISGGVTIDTTISSGGYMEVALGGVASATTINGGFEAVDNGGIAGGTVINSGGTLDVGAGFPPAGTMRIRLRQEQCKS
jgi:autotransporter passenger strand-loop-strand repeat protein